MRRNPFLYLEWMRLMFTCPNLSEDADRVGGQLRGDKECRFSDVTKSGRVWRKVPENDARSVWFPLGRRWSWWGSAVIPVDRERTRHGCLKHSGLSERYGLLVAQVLVTAAEQVPIRVANVTETNVSHTVRNSTWRPRLAWSFLYPLSWPFTHPSVPASPSLFRASKKGHARSKWQIAEQA